ncbi:Fe-S cluster assembly protein SufD [Synechococcales cyanobacterium C]|uniref:Fe-S cluster assembly protein SufD n=1 Tax=Petrachloros mirabilis ULC683 TaxID=2781853 RepID=A0A8K2A7B9_9CYAN|nr:Fe-S cluster assembly protein SufD [Petrachloros mirabilis]NCJ06741.1 Fe-S cluster assembly protein SufD [Petrachloros mirabilis ULC683]
MSIEVSTPNARPHSTGVDRDAVLKQWLTLRADLPQAPDWVQGVRDRALPLLQEQALPTLRDEDWRFTDLAPLYQVAWQAASPTGLQIGDLPLRTGLEGALQLICVNGFYAPHLSTTDSNLTVQSLTTLEPSLQPYLGQQPQAGDVFASLNTYSLSDVLVLRVPPNQSLEQPIHCLFITVGDLPIMAHPRLLVVAESGSVATLIEDYVSLGTAPVFTNAVSELFVAANATLNHVRLQRQSLDTFHIGKTGVTQAQDSHYRAFNLSWGAQISRHEPEVILQGAQTDTQLDGLTLAVGTQLADTHSAIAFQQPRCTARQLHKCIIDDRARAVFNGKIFVPKVAQETNAGQLSRNLLLSPKARVDTKPQLEIVADNVKCAHGATVSQLDADEVFYLQSRGLDHDSACDLLVNAFATEVIDKVPVPELRPALRQAILAQLHS